MKAMILAAGLGTRLRPLTDNRPKALVTVAGRTMLEIALMRLKNFGVQEVIVNVHHHAGMVTDYLKANNYFGMRIEISREEILLDTGGGLKKAADFFLQSGGEHELFILHNVDVISTIDLRQMVRAHVEKKALATLAVQKRDTSRYLLFDENGLLCGRRTGQAGKDELTRVGVGVHPLAFCGVHVISAEIFAKLRDEGVFSIIDSYLKLVAQGGKIAAFDANEYRWRDLGRPESVEKAADEINKGMYSDV